MQQSTERHAVTAALPVHQADVAAMEAVLADYQILRSQITEAEAQLTMLQSTQSDGDSQRLQDTASLNSGCQPARASSSNRHKSISARQIADDQLNAVLCMLQELKLAAAKQKPAVEAVASQLRAAFTKNCTHI